MQRLAEYALWGSLRLHDGDMSVRCYMHGEDGDKVELVVDGALDASQAVKAAEEFLEEQEGQSYGCDDWRPA